MVAGSGTYRDEKMLNQSINNSLSFKKKTARIDWRKIAAVDLDRVVRDLDVFVLQDNIDQLTFCNIESEIDTRMIDPNYIKLFKMCQFTIEYLMHSQNYLTDVISTLELQFSSSVNELDELKKNHEKMTKEIGELKKENKKRKKMIETQQTLLNVSSSNYHQCAYCSKVFLNVSYLQAHMTRRHPEISQFGTQRVNPEIEKELERIKERLRATENELALEKNLRMGLNSNNQNESLLLKQVEEFKNNEIKRQKEEMKKTKESMRKQINELNEKNMSLEKKIKEMQERVGSKSNVGWIKDDIDIQKDTALKQKEEIDKLNQMIANYEVQIEEIKKKFKSKEEAYKQKIIEREEKIAILKAKLEEMQNSIGKNEKELTARITELQDQLQTELIIKRQYEEQLAELRNRPPPITPRQQPNTPGKSRSPSPTKPKEHHEKKPKQTMPNDLIYLSEYCPLTLAAVSKNPNHLQIYKDYALELFEKELDELGIDINEKGLSDNDYKMKMAILNSNRSARADDMVAFNEMRDIFAEISEKHASQKLNSSLRSSLGNRVKFNPEILSAGGQGNKPVTHQSKVIINAVQNKHREQEHINEETEETEEDVSLSNAMESQDEEDTEPTGSKLNDLMVDVNMNKRNESGRNSSNLDEISELESLSHQLSEKLNTRKAQTQKHSTSTVNQNKKQLEKQFDMIAKKGLKPSPNAVPIGFQQSSSVKNRNQIINNNNNEEFEDSFSSVTELENESKPGRQRSALRSSLQDSNSSSMWVTESNSNEINQINNHQPYERPPTANSLKTSNFDSDEVDNGI